MSTRQTTSPLVSYVSVTLVLALALVLGLSTFSEPDAWWHLRVGQLIRDTGQLTAWDPSAAFATRPYVATQWLPEAVASTAYSALNAGALLWLRAVAVVTLVAVVYRAARRYAGRLPASVAAGLMLIGAGGGLNPRPQLVSFVLFAVTVHAWCGMVADRKPRWWLPVLFWLWACSHGLWTFGLALGALMLVAVAVDPSERPSRQELSGLARVWAACLVAVAITPAGPALLNTPFSVAGNASMIAEEWRPTPFNNVFSWTALLMLMLCAALWALKPHQRKWWQIALLGFAAFCVLWMWRLVPLGCIAVAPLLAGGLQDHLRAGREPFARGERQALVAGCSLLLTIGAAVCATPVGTNAQAYPGALGPIDGALTGLPDRTVVLNDFGISGWLLWAHPDLVPVADLRGEIYSRDYLVAYQDVLAVRPGWHSFLDATNPQAALLSRDSALADALAQRLHWTTVAATDEFVLLRSKTP